MWDIFVFNDLIPKVDDQYIEMKKMMQKHVEPYDVIVLSDVGQELLIQLFYRMLQVHKTPKILLSLHKMWNIIHESMPSCSHWCCTRTPRTSSALKTASSPFKGAKSQRAGKEIDDQWLKFIIRLHWNWWEYLSRVVFWSMGIMNSFTLEVFQSEEQIMTCFLKLQFGPHIFLRPPMAGQTWAPEPSPISTVEIMRFDIIAQEHWKD